MKTSRWLWGAGVALGAVLAACVPAPLRAQAGAQLQISARLSGPAVTTVTGETLYRPPGPAALLVSADRPAYVSSLVLTGNQPVQVIAAGPVAAGREVSVPLPPSTGFTQVYTVASLQPLDLSAAQGARSLDDAGRAVQGAARSLPAGAYTVTTTVFTVGRFGTLRVTASEPGAEVRVDGHLAGVAPLTLTDVPVGSVTVSVSVPGASTQSQRISVPEDGVAEVRAVLVPITGTLSVASDVPAQVIVAGRVAGQALTRARPLLVTLRPGTVGVNVVPLDTTVKPQNLLVRIRARQVTTIRCTFDTGAYGCVTP
jgi:hypothetical protein